MQIAICDDHPKIVEWLAGVIEQRLEGENRIARFFDAPELEIYLRDTVRGQVDVIFLDIDLPGENGISLAKKIQSFYPQIKIVFITGYIEFAQRIFEVRPAYFLLKPISAEAVMQALERVLEIMARERQTVLSFQTKNGLVSVPCAAIRYLESRDKLLLIYESENRWETRLKLDEAERRLPDYFVRCHQSCMVNMNSIQNFSAEEIRLYSGERIPVSRSRQKQAREKFLAYLGDVL